MFENGSVSTDFESEKSLLGVLVAISIPIFTSQLEKSRDATSVSNMRAAYAEIMTCVIAGTKGQDRVDGPDKGGDGTYKVEDVVIKSQQANSWSGLATELPFNDHIPGDTGANTNQTLTIKITDGAVADVTLS